jgi:hypothetical protein
MADTRESVILRLLAVGQDLGYKTVVRNRGLRAQDKRPALAVLDGDETPVLTHGGRQNRAQGGRSLPLVPSVLGMRPEIYILLDDRPNDDTTTGTDLNTRRMQLVHAIAGDAQLQALIGSNGTILYNGCVTDLKSGGALSGQMQLNFQFNYVFFPTTNQQGVS